MLYTREEVLLLEEVLAQLFLVFSREFNLVKQALLCPQMDLFEFHSHMP